MEKIDEILIQLEDQLHGELGNLVTKARKLLAIKASFPSMPSDEEIDDVVIQTQWHPDAFESAKWMRSQCDGLIKQKAVEFLKWKEKLKPRQLITVHGDGQTPYVRDLTEEELYEIFNQQER